ncbi:MAG: hypothetical protein HUJ58_09300, partial [Erysipelotrichaceae bacterium]|nr:hypothetical protein [Erysipelotrichaceae bacterium]
MKNYQIILIVFVAASVVMVTVVPMLRKKIYNSLLVLLRNKDFPKLYEMLDKPTTVFLLPKAQSLYIRLQGALAEKSDQVDAILDALIPLVKDTKAKNELIMRGFNYYVDKEDKETAKKYLDLVNGTSNDNMKKEANRVYHIYIDKSDEDLEDLLK